MHARARARRELRQIKKEFYINPDAKLDERIRRLRQANYKMEYKQRHSATKDGTPGAAVRARLPAARCGGSSGAPGCCGVRPDGSTRGSAHAEAHAPHTRLLRPCVRAQDASSEGFASGEEAGETPGPAAGSSRQQKSKPRSLRIAMANVATQLEQDQLQQQLQQQANALHSVLGSLQAQRQQDALGTLLTLPGFGAAPGVPNMLQPPGQPLLPPGGAQAGGDGGGSVKGEEEEDDGSDGWGDGSDEGEDGGGDAAAAGPSMVLQGLPPVGGSSEGGEGGAGPRAPGDGGDGFAARRTSTVSLRREGSGHGHTPIALLLRSGKEQPAAPGQQGEGDVRGEGHGQQPQRGLKRSRSQEAMGGGEEEGGGTAAGTSDGGPLEQKRVERSDS